MFLTQLEVRALDGDEWVLLKPLKYHMTYKIYLEAPKHLGREIIVPSGFVTDLASVPGPLRGLVSGVKETRKPAVVHDYLYRKKIGTRAWADAVFREAMKDTKTPFWKRWICWAGVRIGGWSSR